MAHPFTFGHGLLRLTEVVGGGIAYGLVVAVVIGRLRRHIHDPAIQILVSLIIPFVAYIPAEQLDISGGLATVVTGAYLGTRTEGLFQPSSRAAGTLFWQMLIFLLESTLFVLLGLELRSIVGHVSGALPAPWLAAGAALGSKSAEPADAPYPAATTYCMWPAIPAVHEP
jgi:NhaP-type Na+/H+ or K+/H+ antiporter